MFLGILRGKVQTAVYFSADNVQYFSLRMREMLPERKECATVGNRKSETECKVAGSKRTFRMLGHAIFMFQMVCVYLFLGVCK